MKFRKFWESLFKWTYLRAQEELEELLELVSKYFGYVRSISELRKTLLDHWQKFCEIAVFSLEYRLKVMSSISSLYSMQ